MSTVAKGIQPAGRVTWPAYGPARSGHRPYNLPSNRRIGPRRSAIVDAGNDAGRRGGFSRFYRGPHMDCRRCTTANGLFPQGQPERHCQAPLAARPRVGGSVEISLDIDMVSARPVRAAVILLVESDQPTFDQSRRRSETPRVRPRLRTRCPTGLWARPSRNGMQAFEAGPTAMRAWRSWRLPGDSGPMAIPSFPGRGFSKL